MESLSWSYIPVHFICLEGALLRESQKSLLPAAPLQTCFSWAVHQVLYGTLSPPCRGIFSCHLWGTPSCVSAVLVSMPSQHHIACVTAVPSFIGLMFAVQCCLVTSLSLSSNPGEELLFREAHFTPFTSFFFLFSSFTFHSIERTYLKTHFSLSSMINLDTFGKWICSLPLI